MTSSYAVAVGSSVKCPLFFECWLTKLIWFALIKSLVDLHVYIHLYLPSWPHWGPAACTGVWSQWTIIPYTACLGCNKQQSAYRDFQIFLSNNWHRLWREAGDSCPCLADIQFSTRLTSNSDRVVTLRYMVQVGALRRRHEAWRITVQL